MSGQQKLAVVGYDEGTLQLALFDRETGLTAVCQLVCKPWWFTGSGVRRTPRRLAPAEPVVEPRQTSLLDDDVDPVTAAFEP